MGLSRDSYRNVPLPNEQTVALSAAIIDIARVRRRFGYRRIHDLLRPTFPAVNHKRVYRLYSEADLAVNRRNLLTSRSDFLPIDWYGYRGQVTRSKCLL